jgi:tetratricopeptide (TPR) repeat protein
VNTQLNHELGFHQHCFLFCILKIKYYLRKQKGNELYTQKSYTAAVEAYSKAIELDSGNALLYNNRAAAHLMLLQYKEALHDTDTAISLDNGLSRAYFRKATALKGLGRLDAALTAVQAGLVFDATNKAALQDQTLLIGAKQKIEEAKDLLERGQTTAALIRVDAVVKDVSSNLREVNLLKVECLIKLRRLEEALNLTNTMVSSSLPPFPSIYISSNTTHECMTLLDLLNNDCTDENRSKW